MSSRPPADDLAIQLAIEHGLERSQSILEARQNLAQTEEHRQYADAALESLRERQSRVGGDEL